MGDWVEILVASNQATGLGFVLDKQGSPVACNQATVDEVFYPVYKTIGE